jgi:hypothetical protein
MKAFLAALIALAVITVGANQFLNRAGFSAAEVYSRDSVRLGE